MYDEPAWQKEKARDWMADRWRGPLNGCLILTELFVQHIIHNRVVVNKVGCSSKNLIRHKGTLQITG
ncbi:MAG: hypothetical protein UU65_C0004G0036 [candidate division CPR2 bacterium GW2011_GWC1_41_48]|uniref:Uncharacterized protein n=1 Tax=candidate division CPR2 bacterium GW2011_GWC1_41_48 TaxID=1618344 RepID=A0A0G0W782_UNCC2|nr:MAG: hypothetical protein UT47_C0004G0084 [candidate division CPR2 bacterium GW2011_GWC2_39_35]KKR27712.1 MAG: hypothetical protein UT60_C0039G0003 [candidate division CPR2 bacterium GW2011_GWD2_39_7]KKS08825.1 MAG: hypothetical protein UU65_C0004G0036 [candidate division CPR2 bacterium GW2011_GWC1_41_48]